MASVVRSSKFRHVYGEEQHERFDDVQANLQSSESSLVASNGDFYAVSWHSHGPGIIGAFTPSDIGRIKPHHGLIKGHEGAICDLKFNPFSPSQLLSASADHTIKLWHIPDEGLSEDMQDPILTLHGHSKKVTLLDFHPSALGVVCSASLDKSVKVWSIERGAAVFDYPGVPDTILTCKWSPEGRLIGLSTRDKNASVLDPRTSQKAAVFPTHDGVKPSKANWVSETSMVTCGFSKSSGRQIAFWDLRNTGSPTKLIHVDQGSGIMFPYYDADTTLLFVCAKGDASIRYYEVADDVYFLGSYQGGAPCKGFDFIPKRKVDHSVCEVMRCAKLAESSIVNVSFRVPRRDENFQEDIFPPCISGEPGLSSEEWINGSDVAPPRCDIRSVKTQTAEISIPKTPQDYEKELAEAYARIKVLEERVATLEGQLKDN